MIQVSDKTRIPFKEVNCSDSDLLKILFEFLITENEESSLIVNEMCPLSVDMDMLQAVPINAMVKHVMTIILLILI